MNTVVCDNCDDTVTGNDDHWVHVSIYHHNDPDYSGKWDKNNPRNFAASLCPDCARAVIDGAGGD